MGHTPATSMEFVTELMTSPDPRLMRAMQNQAAERVIGFLASWWLEPHYVPYCCSQSWMQKKDKRALPSLVALGLVGVDGVSANLASSMGS